MAETVLVRPRRGLILAGIPRNGAEISAELAEDWIAAQLVERVPTPAVIPIKSPAKAAGKSTRPAASARKRRRTRGK